MARQYQSLMEPATVTIESGAALSDAYDLQGKSVIGLILPGEWTAAAVSFDVSVDGATYVPLYSNFEGAEVAISYGQAGASRGYALNPSNFLPWRYVKVRSGTDGSTTNQAAEREITLVTRPI